MAKLLLFGLAEFFPVDRLYSSATVGKDAVFGDIKKHYGAGNNYVAVGDGAEEQQVAGKLQMKFIPIHSLNDLRKLTRKAERTRQHASAQMLW